MRLSGFQNFDLRIQLQVELVNRCQSNAQYSLRAFARALDVESSVLSKILSGKRSITAPMHQKIGLALGYDAKTLSNLYKERDHLKTTPARYQKLARTVFSIVSDWYHYAILEMSKLDHFKADAGLIAKRLGITEHQARQALKRLLSIGLLKSSGEKKVQISSEANSNEGALGVVSSPTLRKLQRQVLEKALQALKEIPVEERSQSSMTMAIDPRLLPKARDLIKKFRRKLCDELQSSSCLTEVYQLSVSLYPLTNLKKGVVPHETK